MKKLILLVCACSLALTACSGMSKEKLGLTKKGPNEFMVVPQAPLALPPDYDYTPVKVEQSKNIEVKLNNLSPTEAAFVSKFDANK